MGKKRQFSSLEEMSAATAAALADGVAGFAFQLFQDEEFRRLARFDRLSQAEHDRIFNELVIAYLVLVMLVLEAPDLRVDGGFREYLADLLERIPKAYVEKLRIMGIEEKHLKEWDQLIAMRHEEYARDRHSVRAAAMELESEEKDLDLKDLANIQLMLPIEAVAIGAHHHICRSKVKGRDDLFKLLLRSLSQFYVQFRGSLELGRIGPVMRARMGLRRMFRRLGFKRR